tara:strand:+ start:83 stop:367 length:285 start_codon:yes stop_codon:yes gene_type:complete
MVPKSIKLSDDKKSIIIKYSNKEYLILLSSKLRALSPSAENKNNLKNPDFRAYEKVLIKQIEKVGNYAIRILFSDNHNTGIFSWDYLYEIGLKS